MARAKEVDLPAMDGPGVAPPKHKDLDRLGDKFIDVRDQKAKLAETLGDLENQLAEKMAQHGLTRYKFSDQEIVLTPAKTHIKIKTVKAISADSEPDIDPDDEP